MHPNIYTPESLAERWECSPAHVRKMCASGDLPAFRLGTKLWRIKPADVEAYEARPAVEPNGQATEVSRSFEAKAIVKRLKEVMSAERLKRSG